MEMFEVFLRSQNPKVQMNQFLYGRNMPKVSERLDSDAVYVLILNELTGIFSVIQRLENCAYIQYITN